MGTILPPASAYISISNHNSAEILASQAQQHLVNHMLLSKKESPYSLSPLLFNRGMLMPSLYFLFALFSLA